MNRNRQKPQWAKHVQPHNVKDMATKSRSKIVHRSKGGNPDGRANRD